MNGGGDRTSGSCFNHYTGYHGQRSQDWGIQNPQMLSSDVSSVPSDGLYQYDASTKSLIPANPATRFLTPVATGIPVVTFVSMILFFVAHAAFIASHLNHNYDNRLGHLAATTTHAKRILPA